MLKNKMNKILYLIVFYLCRFVTCQMLHKGDKCTLKDGRQGLCIAVFDCTYATELLEKGQKPEHCGEFIGKYPVVCCPKKKSEISCIKYHGLSGGGSFVSNGEKTLAKEFPHMAILGYGNQGNPQWLCGGTLISDQFVLTAAHCRSAREIGQVKWVRLGDLDIKKTDDDAKPQNFGISEIFVHPQYKSSSHYHDIALLKLDHRAVIDDYVTPACLHTEKSITFDSWTVAGWGKTDFYGETSSHLMKATLNRVDYKTCNDRYSNAKQKLKRGIIDDIQVCAGHPEGKDTCPGDSGGPLQYKIVPSSRKFNIIGVTSFGKGCGSEDSIGVYTRVSPYLEWIEGIVWTE